MENPHRRVAEIHKFTHPEDPRTLEELEDHYRNMAMQSPLGRAMTEIAVIDNVESKIFD